MPADYRVAQFFILLKSDETTARSPLVVPVNPGAVIGVAGVDYEGLDARLRQILEQSVDLVPGKQGKALYDALDPVRKACLLNIAAKARATTLLDGSTCLDHLGPLIKLRGDRFFARTGAALREEAKNARLLFQPAPELLHHPPDGYTPAGSMKSIDRYGNLQLSFFRKGTTGDDYLVDVDIDEASGIEHGFEVARNFLTDRTTSPYDLRDILIRHQLLDPGYSFVFAGEAQIAGAGSA